MDEMIRKQKTRPTVQKALVFIGLILGGVLLNYLGAFFAGIAGIPVYLDVIGTMVTSMLGGYLPGIFVALAGPVINTVTGADPAAISYTILNVLIAIITAFFYEKKYMEKAQGVMTAMILDALVGGVLGGIITWFIYGAEGEDTSSSLVHGLVSNMGMSPFGAELVGGFFVDLADKAICLFLALTIVYCLPLKARKMFKIHAWRQAPLSGDVLKNIREKRSRQASLRLKLVALLTIAAVVIGASFKGAAHGSERLSGVYRERNPHDHRGDGG